MHGFYIHRVTITKNIIETILENIMLYRKKHIYHKTVPRSICVLVYLINFSLIKFL